LALCGSSRLASSVDELAETPNAALVIPGQRPVPKHLSKPQPLGLSPVQDRLDDVRRQAREREQPTDVGVRDAFLLCEIGDRLGLSALDPPPPTMRPDERLDQGLISTRLRGRLTSPFECDDELTAAPAM
jgi:hypothetical protein